MVRLPHAGFFKFQLFALPAADSTESLPNVFNYLIEVHKLLHILYTCSFPYAYSVLTMCKILVQ